MIDIEGRYINSNRCTYLQYYSKDFAEIYDILNLKLNGYTLKNVIIYSITAE